MDSARVPYFDMMSNGMYDHVLDIIERERELVKIYDTIVKLTTYSRVRRYHSMMRPDGISESNKQNNSRILLFRNSFATKLGQHVVD